MKKQIISVPKGIRFISEWEEFSLPTKPTIINKTITGCGFTEYCIRNNQNIILCSPRKILLENKESQHPGEVYYVRNDIDTILEIDKDLSNLKLSSSKDSGKNDEESLKILSEKQLMLRGEVLDYYHLCNGNKKPCKILVTYDSFRHVKEALGGLIDSFFIVVDEFQSIFTDSRFKSDTELEFLNYLRDLSNLAFVSATPMLDKYLSMLDEFKDLPYIELDWEKEDAFRVFKPQIEVHPCQSILKPAKTIIGDYLSGLFDKYSYIDEFGKYQEIVSREVVIYVNSVKNICDIIKSCGLTIDNTNVLCSNTSDNQKKVKQAFNLKGKVFSSFNPIGTVPRQGEPHKMFTLCTRTVYLGADFYSTCARSIILSDANVDCLAVDISLDLPQILGRQRLNENPWKNRAELYFKSLSRKNLMSQEEFNGLIQKKLDLSKSRLRIYEETAPELKYILAQDYKDRAKSLNYTGDYVSVNLHAGKTLIPVINNLVLVSELRAFEIQQVDYKDRFSVFNTITSITSNSTVSSSIMDKLSQFEAIPYFTDKMKFLCELPDNEEFLSLLNLVPLVYKNYIQTLGKERIRNICFQKSKLEAEYQRLKNNGLSQDSLTEDIYKNFIVGKKYSLSSIKALLKNIYSINNIDAAAKASDLERYFELKSTKVLDSSGKWVNAFELLSSKIP